MIIVLLFISILVLFPASIFLDYHTERNIHKAVWYLLFFIVCFGLLGLLVKELGLHLVYYLLIVPVGLFGGLALKQLLKRK